MKLLQQWKICVSLFLAVRFAWQEGSSQTQIFSFIPFVSALSVKQLTTKAVPSVSTPSLSCPTLDPSDNVEEIYDFELANNSPATSSFNPIARSEFLRAIGMGLLLTSSSVFQVEPAIAASSTSTGTWGVSPDRPVAVIGANGRTGMEVLQALARQELYSVSLTRTGVDPFRVVKLAPELKSYMSHYNEPISVTDQDALRQALLATKASAILYCASASKQGGSAFEVDDVGVGTVAKLAKEMGARLIVISALAVDRPDSKSFQITNTIGGNYRGIMDAKRQGEEKVRASLQDYVILRPGVLLNGKSVKGVSDLELNQGDFIGGGLSRDELANLMVAALQSGKQGLTVEVYRHSTATKLQPDFPSSSGKEVTGASSYQDLFRSV